MGTALLPGDEDGATRAKNDDIVHRSLWEKDTE